MKNKILIIDDDQINLMTTSSLLEQWGYEVDTASDGKTGISKGIMDVDYSVILLDFRMPDKSGDEVAKEIFKVNKKSIILMYSCDDSRETVKKSFRAGVADFIDKDEDLDKLRQTLEKYCRQYDETARLLKAQTTKSASETLIASVGMVGRSALLAEAVRKVLRYRNSKDALLIVGESGTGKELLAAAVHSGPKDKFKVINCAAFKDSTHLLESELFGYEKGAFTGAVTSKAGILEVANGGTVFFDELHQLSLEAQAKLLRVFQEQKIRRVGGRDEYKIDFRLVAAAQTDLEERVRQGKFLLDLYYRVNVLKIEVPSLCERPEDIGPLVHYYCQKHYEKTGQRKNFLAQTVRVMERYSWPGNVRELSNTIVSLMMDTQNETITPSNLDSRFDGLDLNVNTFSDLKNRQDLETRKFITDALNSSKTVVDAAGRIGLPPSTLYSMISRFGIKDPAV